METTFDIVLDYFVKYHEAIIEVAENNVVPTYFYRFEDIIPDTESQLVNIVKFIFGKSDISGTVVEQLIKDFVVDKDKGQVYKPKSGGAFNKNLDKYNEKQMASMKTKLRKYNVYFDYIKLPGRVTETDYFEYDDLTEEELKQVGRYRVVAAQALKYSIEKGDSVADCH